LATAAPTAICSGCRAHRRPRARRRRLRGHQRTEIFPPRGRQVAGRSRPQRTEVKEPTMNTRTACPRRRRRVTSGSRAANSRATRRGWWPICGKGRPEAGGHSKVRPSNWWQPWWPWRTQLQSPSGPVSFCLGPVTGTRPRWPTMNVVTSPVLSNMPSPSSRPRLAEGSPFPAISNRSP
jgi:hypothetical protein